MNTTWFELDTHIQSFDHEPERLSAIGSRTPPRWFSRLRRSQ